ncbi:PLC-like phosphodiesterase [Pelagophyceae sp. CCMP2097]|nr:PLC-like phosphodiesterase [Pelagophyceae sp. CCMP2097]
MAQDAKGATPTVSWVPGPEDGGGLCEGPLCARASAKCCTTDITLADFKTLCAKMDASVSTALTAAAYQGGTAPFRTDLYAQCGEPVSHAESIQIIKHAGAKFTPELKTRVCCVDFFKNSEIQKFKKVVQEYVDAGIPATDVWMQSFNLADIQYWIANYPNDFGRQADFTWKTRLDGEYAPSELALAADAAGFKIITWTLERSGPLSNGGGWYYGTVASITKNDGDMMELLDVLVQQVGVIGVFSDWPATVAFYANCMTPIDSNSWHKKGNPSKGCKWVASYAAKRSVQERFMQLWLPRALAIF